MGRWCSRSSFSGWTAVSAWEGAIMEICGSGPRQRQSRMGTSRISLIMAWNYLNIQRQAQAQRLVCWALGNLPWHTYAGQEGQLGKGAFHCPSSHSLLSPHLTANGLDHKIEGKPDEKVKTQHPPCRLVKNSPTEHFCPQIFCKGMTGQGRHRGAWPFEDVSEVAPDVGFATVRSLFLLRRE